MSSDHKLLLVNNSGVSDMPSISLEAPSNGELMETAKTTGEDSALLQRLVGEPLKLCLKDVVETRPRDPIEYIAQWLYRYVDHKQYFMEKYAILKNLDVEYHRMRKEKKQLLENKKKINKNFKSMFQIAEAHGLDEGRGKKHQQQIIDLQMESQDERSEESNHLAEEYPYSRMHSLVSDFSYTGEKIQPDSLHEKVDNVLRDFHDLNSISPGLYNMTANPNIDPEIGTGFDPKTGYGFDPTTQSGFNTGTGSGFDPMTGPGFDQKTGSGLDPKIGSGFDPNTGSGFDPKTGSGLNPNTGSKFDPTTGSSFNTKARSGFDPKTGSGFDPTTGFILNTGDGSGFNPKTGSGFDPTTGSSFNTDTESGFDPKTGSGFDPNTGSGFDPTTGSELNLNTGTGSDLDQNTESGFDSQSKRLTPHPPSGPKSASGQRTTKQSRPTKRHASTSGKGSSMESRVENAPRSGSRSELSKAHQTIGSNNVSKHGSETCVDSPTYQVDSSYIEKQHNLVDQVDSSYIENQLNLVDQVDSSYIENQHNLVDEGYSPGLIKVNYDDSGLVNDPYSNAAPMKLRATESEISYVSWVVRRHDLALICKHPSLGRMEPRPPLLYPETPEWWHKQGYLEETLYDHELYSCNNEDELPTWDTVNRMSYEDFVRPGPTITKDGTYCFPNSEIAPDVKSASKQDHQPHKHRKSKAGTS